MDLTLTVIARDPATEKKLAQELEKAAAGLIPVRVEIGSDGEPAGQVVFIELEGEPLAAALARIDRNQRAVFVIAPDGSVPDAVVEGIVDDALIRPFRPLELMSKLNLYQQLMMWNEVSRLNTTFTGVLEQLREDVGLVERLQKGKLPTRFSEIKGFKAAHRYLAGMRSGGDHFDLAESKNGERLSLLLSDSSSYGLSSALLSILMRVAMKLSSEDAGSSLETVRRIHEELLLILGDKDRLSIFYGVVTRRDYCLRYLNLGSSRGFIAPPGQRFAPLVVHGPALSKADGFAGAAEESVTLEPDSRFALVSDGFIESLGGEASLIALLDRFRSREAKDCLNELAFGVKSRFATPDDMPLQDCTAVILDMDSRVLRLTPSRG